MSALTTRIPRDPRVGSCRRVMGLRSRAGQRDSGRQQDGGDVIGAKLFGDMTHAGVRTGVRAA